MVWGIPIPKDKDIGCFTGGNMENCSDLCDLKDILPKMRRQGPDQRVIFRQKKRALPYGIPVLNLAVSRAGRALFLGPADQARN